MTRHTPGPWRVEHGLDSSLRALPEVVQIMHDLEAPSLGAVRYIADLLPHIHGTTPHHLRAETEANGRLIAAAPDLLAACREAADLLELVRGLVAALGYAGYATALQDGARNIRAAIARATEEE